MSSRSDFGIIGGASPSRAHRIDYRREHLYRLGTITRPHQLNGSQLREARDLHLLALRETCGREDFGEAFEGRT